MFKLMLSFIAPLGFLRLCLGGDSGGGGGTQTTTASTVPEYARPYFEDLLGRSQALTATPTQMYGGERLAGFTPMQQQSFASTQNMKAGPEAFNAQVGQYMSPYMQNVVDVQRTAAIRASDIAGQKQQAGAAQAGAFGGYRDAIERSEREKALGSQLDTIQKTGMQDAFGDATSAYNQGQGQQQDIAKLQNMMGTQQQQQQQQYLTNQYQDFQTEQAAPYKQLGFMSDILHGTPGSQSAQTVFQAPPNQMAQLAGLGTVAASFMGGKKEGGLIKLAEGGLAGAVPDERQLRAALSKMPDAQLAQVVASGRYNPEAQQEQQRRSEMRGAAVAQPQEAASPQGIAALPAPAVDAMAEGGIVAFADGGDTDTPEVAESAFGHWWRKQQEQAQQSTEKDRQAQAFTNQGYAAAVSPFESVTPTERASRERAAQQARLMAQAARKGALSGTNNDPSKFFGEQAAAPAQDTPSPTPATAAAPTPAPTVAKKAPAAPSADGLPGLIVKRSTKSSGADAPAPAMDTYKAPTLEETLAAQKGIAADANKDTDSAFKEYVDRLNRRDEELKESRSGAKNAALLNAGLAMMSSRDPDFLSAVAGGAKTGLDSYRASQKEYEKAMESQDHSRMLLAQAQRAERSGNMKAAAEQYGQWRQEKGMEAQYRQRAADLAQRAQEHQETLRAHMQTANRPAPEVQLVERMQRDPEFAATYKDMLGTRGAGRDMTAARKDWASNILLQQQFPTFAAYYAATQPQSTMPGNNPALAGWGQPQPVK